MPPDHQACHFNFISTTLPVPWSIPEECTTLWGEPDRVHAENMEQLHTFDCHQNVAEPQATENHIKYTHVYTGTVSQATKTNRIDRSPCSYNIALATE